MRIENRKIKKMAEKCACDIDSYAHFLYLKRMIKRMIKKLMKRLMKMLKNGSKNFVKGVDINFGLCYYSQVARM